MALSSFLDRCWEQSRLAAVPVAFVLGTLLPAAGQAHLWRGEGADELQGGVAAWVGRYTASQPLRERRELLLAMLGLLAGGGSSAAQQWPLAQTVAGALAAAAQSLLPDAGPSSSPEEEQQWQLQFLQRLEEATRQLSATWGSGGPTGSYAMSICSSLLQVAACTVPLHAGGGSSQLVLAAAATWLQQLPLALLLPGRALHAAAVGWLGSAERQELVPALAACVQQYMEQGASSSAAEAGEAAAAANRASWQQQAGGLARLVVLVACSEAPAGSTPGLSTADLVMAFASWDAVLGSLYRR